MLLVNQGKLEIGAAANEPSHPLHEQAKFYLKSTEYLRETYGKYMHFIDKKQPRYCKGADSRGNDIPKIKEPDTLLYVPLQTYYTDKKRGKELWSCCLSNPVLLPNGLWDLGRNRTLPIKGNLVVNLETDMDLAFYLSYISRFVSKKLLKIDNPAEDAKKEGDRKREQIKRQTAIWNMLDDDKLRMMASAYGVTQTATKTPDRIRLELEKLLILADQQKKGNPAIKGTDDFLDEMKVTDGLLLRAFVQTAIDEKKVIYKPDGKWRVGDKIIMMVSQDDVQKKRMFDALCNWLNSPNNKEKLLEFLTDLMSKEYLETIRDPKFFEWLAKVIGLKTAFQKKSALRKAVFEYFGSSVTTLGDEE